MLSCDLNYIKMKHLRNLDLRKAIACLLDDFIIGKETLGVATNRCTCVSEGIFAE